MDKVQLCPQCGTTIIHPRDCKDYCEDCGWPEENRTSDWMFIRISGIPVCCACGTGMHVENNDKPDSTVICHNPGCPKYGIRCKNPFIIAVQQLPPQ